MRLRHVLLAALTMIVGGTVAVLCVWWLGRGPAKGAPATQAGRATPAGDPGSAREAAGALPIADATAYAELNDTRHPPRNDLRIVTGLIQNYQSSLQSAAPPPPLGFNEEIVRALTGRNPLGVAFLPASHPSINPAGLWCDRWGTPYQFHPLSAATIEVRSAGPDRRLYTSDDVVFAPPRAAAD